MNVLLDVLADLMPVPGDVHPGPLDDQLARWAGNYYASMGLDAELLFDSEVTAILRSPALGAEPAR